ncbi:HNH endonuclease signature motif containing protein [Haloprofundus salinisoli]|uniref:HNH endonuclease signature motif containing protein n=1 Tax=Haloprofundus salinisoli TaxID=2876193 RepID=UPI001CCCEC4B|nr:HNH endonuclease signature motif containing protein [Haloprofundus salinisoli]
MQGADTGAKATPGIGVEVGDERCTVCGADDGLRVHHIDGSRENTRAENLVWMCGACRRRVGDDSTRDDARNDHEFLLPEELTSMVDREFVRLVCECRRDRGWRPDRARHYDPLVVADGVFAVGRMDAEAFEERLSELELR